MQVEATNANSPTYTLIRKYGNYIMQGLLGYLPYHFYPKLQIAKEIPILFLDVINVRAPL